MHNFTDISYDSTNHIFCQIEKFSVKENTSGEFAEADRGAESKSEGYSLEDVFGTEDEK